MPANTLHKRILLQISNSIPEEFAEDSKTILRFKSFALQDKSYIKALKRLLDVANIPPPPSAS